MVPPPASCGEERHIIAPLRCKPPSPFQVIWTKTIVMQGTGTGGRLCSPNLRFWRPALSIELHPYMCASRLDCHTLLAYPCTGTQGSFQRDSASWSSHLEYSVTMPLGRSTGADSVSTRSAGRSRFLCVGTPWQVIAATASASMTGGHHVPSPEPSDAIDSRYSVFPQS